MDRRGLTPSVFTLSLGAAGTDGSILFTRSSGARLTPGTYPVTGHGGRVGRPAGARDDRIGYASDRVKATGFVASDPADEHRPIRGHWRGHSGPGLRPAGGRPN